MLTYRELAHLLKNMHPDHLDDTVTVLYEEEFLPVDHCFVQQGDDVLDDGHYYLIINS